MRPTTGQTYSSMRFIKLPSARAGYRRGGKARFQMHEGQEDRKPSRKRKPSPRARALAVRWIEPDRFPLAVPRPFLHSGIVVYCAGARRWHMVLAAVAERPAIG